MIPFFEEVPHTDNPMIKRFRDNFILPVFKNHPFFDIMDIHLNLFVKHKDVKHHTYPFFGSCWAIDVQFFCITTPCKSLDKPRDTKNVVAVPMANEDLGYFCWGDPCY